MDEEEDEDDYDDDDLLFGNDTESGDDYFTLFIPDNGSIFTLWHPEDEQSSSPPSGKPNLWSCCHGDTLCPLLYVDPGGEKRFQVQTKLTL